MAGTNPQTNRSVAAACAHSAPRESAVPETTQADRDGTQTTMPTLPSEHRTRQLLARAMTILNAAAGEGVFWEGVEEPEDFLFEVANEMGFGNSDDPWEDMIRMLNQ